MMAVNDGTYYRKIAAEIEEQAKASEIPDMKRSLAIIAAQYLLIADLVERRRGLDRREPGPTAG